MKSLSQFFWPRIHGTQLNTADIDCLAARVALNLGVARAWGCWWLNPPHLKNMLVKLDHFPQRFGMKVTNISVATTQLLTNVFYESTSNDGFMDGSFPSKICRFWGSLVSVSLIVKEWHHDKKYLGAGVIYFNRVVVQLSQVVQNLPISWFPSNFLVRRIWCCGSQVQYINCRQSQEWNA